MNRYVSVYFKTWAMVHQLKILWLLLACKFKVILGNKVQREQCSQVKLNPRGRFHNRLFLKTRLTPLLGQINSGCKVLTTKLRKVSNIREGKTVNAINQLPIKPLRAQLYTLTALPLHRKEWLATGMVEPLLLPSKESRDSASQLWMPLGTVEVSWVQLWAPKKYNKEAPLVPLMDSKMAAL